MRRWHVTSWGDLFEVACVGTGTFAGLIYVLGPQRLRSAPAYAYINSIGEGTQGMQLLGLVWLAGALCIFGSRALSPRQTGLRRVGHSLSAGAYFFISLDLAYSIFTPVGTSGAAWTPYAIVCLLHIYFGTHEPALLTRVRTGTG